MVALGLYPAQIAVPVAGVAVFNTGLTKVVPIFQAQIVLHVEVVQPKFPPVRLASTSTLVVAVDVFINAPLE